MGAKHSTNQDPEEYKTDTMEHPDVSPKEIYQENIRLRDRLEAIEIGSSKIKSSGNIEERLVALEHARVKQSDRARKYIYDDDIRSKKSCCERYICRRGTFIIVSLIAAFLFLIGFMFYQETQNREILNSMKTETLPNTKSGIEALLGGALSGVDRKNFMNIGLRQDYLIQECQGSEMKQSFPDMDYSMLGYNVLRGYPLAVGHDPGFTLPIFAADYSEGKQTADCRYSRPRGVFLAPDVSCETSFSSTVTQTRFEFASSLSVSAHVSGGGWGLSFSASAGYKESSSEISTGESVFILSSASCTYYFSKLMKKTPPKLHPVFQKWLEVLAETDDKTTYLAFFDTFGTHFPTMVTYGARFTYQHKMTSSSYETQREKGVNVAVQASYSGMFSVGGGFSMDSSQRESASSFSKSVETKTITVGAPPPSNGDAMTWASEVKTSPVPVSYDLESIEYLFTDDYMTEMPLNTTRIVENIKKYKFEYCQMLKQNGETNSCDDVKPGIELLKTRLYKHFKEIIYTLPECIEQCLQNIHCSAITYCTTCSSSQGHFQTCYMYRDDATKERVTGTDENGWVSNVFLAKVKYYLSVHNTKIIGTARSMEDPKDDKADLQRCHEICLGDANCAAYSYCPCPDKTVSCQIYDARNIASLEQDYDSNTYFVSHRAKQERGKTTSTSTSTPTTGQMVVP